MVGEKKIRVLDLEEKEDRNIRRERASRIEEEEGERDKRARENLLFLPFLLDHRVRPSSNLRTIAEQRNRFVY